MTPEEFVSRVTDKGRYRVHFEHRSSWIATVLSAGGNLKLRYTGPHRPPQTFNLIPDSDGALVVYGKDWGRLTRVTRARSQGMQGLQSEPAPNEPPERVMVSIRIMEDQLAEIDRRAGSTGMTRSEYMIEAALGSNRAEHRLAEIDRRLARLENAS